MFHESIDPKNYLRGLLRGSATGGDAPRGEVPPGSRPEHRTRVHRLKVLDAYVHRLPSGLCLKRITQNAPRAIERLDRMVM